MDRRDSRTSFIPRKPTTPDKPITDTLAGKAPEALAEAASGAVKGIRVNTTPCPKCGRVIAHPGSYKIHLAFCKGPKEVKPARVTVKVQLRATGDLKQARLNALRNVEAALKAMDVQGVLAIR